MVRNLAWSGDTPDLQPRPENFADWDQHLTHEQADVVLVVFGFNESFAGQQGLKSFTIDPRFEVNLFASEEEFPNMAAAIQMRWDALGRLWVSCSTTYPHVYPGNEPNDKLVILEDTDGDGKADKSSVFADDLHIPLSFEYSGWFRYRPQSRHLQSFGTYPSTNPWGVTFDDWGQHQASHPIFAAAFHALDPPYPQQHPRPAGLQAYSGTCGQEFVDFDTFPDELRGSFIKARYKPTNRIEIHRWIESEYGYDEQYVGDLIFSSNLSFIPVDLRYGPRGAMYICDWYNPIKGHAQYSLRDQRRDRHSGRIWRITAKDKPLQQAPRIAGASIDELLKLHKRPEYRYRYWAKRAVTNSPTTSNTTITITITIEPVARDSYSAATR